MSTDYSIFVKTPLPVTTIVSGIESILNCSLAHTVGPRREYYSSIVFGLGVSLVMPIPYEDVQIKYSEYDFEMMVEYKGLFDSTFANDFQRIATIVLADMISRNLSCECLAVENLTEVLGKFMPDGS